MNQSINAHSAGSTKSQPASEPAFTDNQEGSEVTNGSAFTPGASGYPDDLTVKSVLTLQRTIGNQATRRLIMRRAADRQAQSLIQRDGYSAKEAEAMSKTATGAKAFWSNEVQKGRITGDSKTKGISTLDFSKITLEDFKAKKPVQDTVFDLAQKTVDNQKSKADAILSNANIKGAEVSALKKRDSLDEFVHGVIQKCEQKPYKYIGEMNDMARGRFNVNSKGDMEKIVKGLTPQAKDIVAPRYKGGVLNYPRYHVITYDPTGMTFEWQIGTKATTEVIEKKGIEVPEELKAAATDKGKKIDAKADLHDIDYAVFSRMIAKHPAVANEYDMPAFAQKGAQLKQKSYEQGEITDELRQETDALLAEASKLLNNLVAGGHTAKIVELLH